MLAISQDELQLAWIGVLYVAVTSVYLWWLGYCAEALLRTIRRDEASTVWETIGAPQSVRQAVLDPRRRWLQFIRSRSYRRLCSPVTASKIDAFRLQTNAGLGVLAVTGAIILWRYWPLLKPTLPGT